MSTLKIMRGDTLELPLGAVTEVIPFLATRGAGKSFAAADFAEELYAHSLQFVVVDPMGVYWGLRSSRDGSKAGLAVTILGGERGDVPLEPTSGRLIADVVVDTGQSFVLDLSLFDSKADQVKFMEAFCERLFYRKGPIDKRTPVMLIVDEADEFAPQKPEKNETRMLGHMIRLAKRGRTRGIGLMPLTQRSAEFHKGILDLASAVVFMRTAGPRDRDAIKKWLAGSAPELLSLVDTKFPKLETGHALIYSPHWLHLDEPVEVTFRLIRTFDSYRTPEPGEVRPAPSKTAPIDLEALGEQIKATAERAKENDPAELRKRVRDLERELDAQKIATDTLARRRDDLERALEERPAETERVEIPAISDEDLQRILDAIGAVGVVLDVKTRQAQEMLQAVMDDPALAAIADALAKRDLPAAPSRPSPTPQRETPTRPAPPPTRPGPEAAADSGASGGEISIPEPRQKILDALRWFETVGVPAPKKVVIAAVAGVSAKSSGFRNNVSGLSAAGLVTYPIPGRVALTETGRAQALEPAYAGTAQDLQQAVFRMVSNPQADLLRVLIDAYPEPVDRETLAARADVSVLSSSFRNNVSRLSSFEMLTYPEPGLVRASDLLFLKDQAGG